MSYKNIIWDTIRFIENEAPKNGYLNITETNWQNYDKAEQIRLRKILVRNGLVRLGDNDQWSFQLTASAMIADKSDFDNNGNLKRSNKEYWRGVKTILIGTIVGAIVGTFLTGILEVWKAKHLSPPQTNIVVHKPIHIIVDTICKK